MSGALLLAYLPPPIGWIAVTPDCLRDLQIAAQEVMGISPTANTPGDKIASTAAANTLLTAEAAADALSVDPQWLLRQAREGRIDHVRIGKYVRFRPDTIIERGSHLAHAPATHAHATTCASHKKRV